MTRGKGPGKLGTNKSEPLLNFPHQPILSKLLRQRDDAVSDEELRAAMILERRFLNSIFENTHACIRPLGDRDRHTGHDRESRPERLHFASVSLSLDFIDKQPAASQYEFVQNEPYLHLTYSDSISIAQFKALVKESVTRAIEIAKRRAGHQNDAVVVSVNEFGFPFFRRSDKRAEFYAELRKLAHEKGAFIICGSSHKVEDMRNIAVLAHPASNEVVEHPKYSPAVNLGEKLKPRMDLDWRYYSFDIGKLGILVCFDAIDPTVFQRQIYYSRDMPENEKIDIFVIPSFSHNDKVRDQAEMLSYFTKSIVLYANHQYGDRDAEAPRTTSTEPRSRSHGLFIGGEDVLSGKAVKFKNSVDIMPPETYELAGTPHWASIQVTTVEYANTIRHLKDMLYDFSPLMREIVEMTKSDRHPPGG